MQMKRSVKQYLRLARFDHWIKQLFILPGVWLACVMAPDAVRAPGALVLRVVVGLAATSLVASANYVINEWLDAESDKYHPVKKDRPCVTETLDARIVWLEYAVFLLTGLVIAFFLNTEGLLMAVALLVMGVLYNVKPFRT